MTFLVNIKNKPVSEPKYTLPVPEVVGCVRAGGLIVTWL